MARIVLDASVLLAHLNGEPGAERAEAYFGDALISAVNWSEAIAKLTERGVSLGLARQALSRYGLQVVHLDQELGEWTGGALRPKTKALGLSLGDRACLAPAQRQALPVLTADKTWKQLDLAIEVQLLR